MRSGASMHRARGSRGCGSSLEPLEDVSPGSGSVLYELRGLGQTSHLCGQLFSCLSTKFDWVTSPALKYRKLFMI